MSGPIRNFRIASGIVTTTGFTLVYTVPANNAVILKFSGLWNQHLGVSNVGIMIQNPASGADIYLASQALNQSQTVIVTTWTVLNSGDLIFVNSDQLQVHYWFAGALLPFVPGLSAVSGATSQELEQPAAISAPLPAATPLPPPTIYLPPTETPVYVSAARLESRAPKGRRAKRGRDS